MSEEEKALELDKVEAALSRALHGVVEGRARDLLYCADNVRFVRDLAAGDRFAADYPPDAREFSEDVLTEAYKLLGIERPCGLTFSW